MCGLRKCWRTLGAAFAILVLCALLEGCTRSTSAPPRNIVLIVLDTTRADRLSIYGYDAAVTPNLARFASQALRFERAYSTSTWTLASHASLFTGFLPATHQATQENLWLDDELDTLAELLGRAGYETVAFTNNSWISDVTNLSQGFDEVFHLWRDGGKRDEDGLPHPTSTAVEEWMSGRETDRPLFLFINYMDPHWPFNPPAPYRERFLDSDALRKVAKWSGFTAISWYLKGRKASAAVLAARSALYDAEIAYLDAAVGELLELLEKRGVLEDSLVVITADHGENLGEHGHQGHSFTLYEPTMRIPLLIRSSDGSHSGETRAEPVQLTDVFTTIARAAGVDTFDARVVGEGLLAAPLAADRPILGEYYFPETFIGRFPDTAAATAAVAPFKRSIRSLQTGSAKLIWGSDGRHELYDLERDPDETENLIEREPERASALEARLLTIVGEYERSPTRAQAPLSQMDEETIANLRALGYIP